MKCFVCGKAGPGNDAFCPRCGQPIREMPEAEAVSKHWEEARREIQLYEEKREKSQREIRSRAKKNWGRWVMLAIVVIAAAVYLNVTPSGQQMMEYGQPYLRGWWAMEQGDYLEAYHQLQQVDPDFLNAREFQLRCEEENQWIRYDEAVEYMNAGDYENALRLFQKLGDYSESRLLAEQCYQQILEGIPLSVHHWRFDEDISEDKGIASESRGDVTVKGVVDSQIRKGAFFDGEGDYVTAGTGLNLTDQWSVTTLVSPMDQEFRTILSKMDWKTGNMVYRLSIMSGHFIWEVATESGDIYQLYGKPAVQPGEQWYHVAVTMQDGTMTLYVDGVLQESFTLPSPVLSGEETVTIGDQAYHDEYSNAGFRGYIADLEMYEYALTELEVEALYHQVQYAATHRWDTSYYFFAEEKPWDHFVFYHPSEDPQRIALAVLHLNQGMELSQLIWLENGVIELRGDAIACYDVYLLDGEEWVRREQGATDQGPYAEELISSDLTVCYEYGEVILEPVLIGGRTE